MSYLVRILPNTMILILNNDTKERKVLKPREIGKFFEQELEPSVKEWDKVDANIEMMKEELSKL